MTGPTRQDTWRCTVEVEHPAPNNDNMINYGVWDKKTGGQVDSEEYKYKPGAMEPHVSLGGTRTTDNLTLSRLYRLGRDHDGIGQLMESAGRSRARVTQQPLDINGNVYGRPIVYTGTLKRVTPPEVDSESSGPAMVEIEITTDGFPTA